MNVDLVADIFVLSVDVPADGNENSTYVVSCDRQQSDTNNHVMSMRTTHTKADDFNN